MKNQNKLILTQNDFRLISSLVNAAGVKSTELLEEELNRASIVSAEELPSDVVSMNSRVVFKDLDTSKEMVVTLVYPNEANIEENKISILAPVGSALIGLRVGQVIMWPMPSGKDKRIEIVSVLSQPLN